ncbi:Protein of unknown function [Anaplasma phagocytophilum]|uniref:Uncharacterized protein n=1 Tax=Anaplasma phagocytophilum TaxID=948 RepID=A0A098GJG8_ANAPH|nr:Protein of unknown function [Anaplasma phagocytophilum]
MFSSEKVVLFLIAINEGFSVMSGATGSGL